MRWQTTAVLAVILIALGVFFYVYEIRLGPEREKAESQKGRVFTVDAKDVTDVEIRRKDDVVRLKREGEGWQMLDPVKARGDRGPIEETLTSIVAAKMDREIAAAPAALEEFGLDKPAAQITLSLKDGKRLGLALGAKSPTGAWVYAREKDKPPVFVVSDGVLRDATRPPADFRDKTVLVFDRQAVTGLEVVTRDDTLALQPAGGRWKLTRPMALEADTQTVSEFFEKLQGGKVMEFVAESPRSLQAFGLERPVRVTIHTGKDKERASKSLLLGRVDAGKKGVYAMRPGESSVLLLPEDVWKTLPRTVAAARNKVLVEFERDKLTRLDIESPRGPVTIVKDKDRWRITAPEALPADQVEVGGVLFKLRELRAQGFLSDDASGIPRYLAKPEVRVALTEEGAAAPTTLLLSPSPERRGGRASAYAAVAGRGPVVLIDASALGEIGRSMTELRDRTLLTGLEPKDIKRVRVKIGGQTALLERSGETDWRMLEPTRGSAKSAKVDDLLYALRALKWKEIAAPKGEEPARYGLDAPGLEVTLLSASGGEIAAVAIGKREAERAFVRTKAAPTIYAVDPRQLGELPKGADDFKG